MLSTLLAECGIVSFGVCAYDPAISDLRCRGRDRIPPTAQTVIVCAFPYFTTPPHDAPQTNLSRYAWIQDYHQICGKMLHRACRKLAQRSAGQFVWFCDNSPLREKEYAYRAGLGKRGRHSLILHPQYGSYFFLGTIVTDVTLPAWDRTKTPLGDCESCGRCITACPQGCLDLPAPATEPSRDATTDQPAPFARCLSHLTQKKGILTPQEEQAVGRHGLVWGCDLCQQACPHNQNLSVTHLAAFFEDVVPTVTPENLPLLMQTRPFAYRGQAVLRRNLSLCERFA